MMRKASVWVVIALLLPLMDLRPVRAQDPVAQLAERVALSIVKVVVNGTTASGRVVTFEGSGLVIGSGPQISVVLTAAHVIGKREFWKTKDDGERASIEVLRFGFVERRVLPLNPWHYLPR